MPKKIKNAENLLKQKIIILSELIEHSSEVNKLLISNAVDMEDGDLSQAQKHMKEASTLLSTMIKDIFVETREILSIQSDIEEDYDLSTLEISKLLSKVCYNAASLIDCYINEYSGSVQENIENKLLKCINATESLVNTILLN